MKNTIRNFLLDKRIPKGPGFELDHAVHQLNVYFDEWRKWNGRINLTSETEARDVLQRHVFDSLQYGHALAPQKSLMDLGSGGGFPGIPLKISHPRMRVVLVESQRKRANFLKQVVRALDLPEVEVHNQRAEELDAALHGAWEAVALRTVGATLESLRLGSPFLAEQGRLLLKKDPGAQAPSAKKLPPGLVLREEVPVQNFYGLPSKLMVFEKRST